MHVSTDPVAAAVLRQPNLVPIHDLICIVAEIHQLLHLVGIFKRAMPAPVGEVAKEDLVLLRTSSSHAKTAGVGDVAETCYA